MLISYNDAEYYPHLTGCSDDNLQLVRLLLAGTRLLVRLRSAPSAWFDTTLGYPQSDKLLPALLTFYLAAALGAVRLNTTRSDPPILTLGMSLEREDANDVDFGDLTNFLSKAKVRMVGEQNREFNIFNLCVTRHLQICVNLVFKHIHDACIYTICV